MQGLNLKFYGGSGSTTGANIMLEYGGKKMLIDCGLFQAAGAAKKNFEPFGYDPKGIDFLLVTHSHMDHIGRIPKLAGEGFRGKIISTPETKELSRIMLEDALEVMKAREPGGPLLFGKEDIEEAFSLWEGYGYGEKTDLFPGCSIEMQDAGHILGSAIINVSCGSKKIAFTGDLGNSPSLLLPDTETVKSADYMVMESVYGDRNHESKEERREKLKKAILGGIKKGGTTVIPAFSIERTQALLYEMNNMIEGGEAPRVPVFLDSPLALKVTDIYKKYSKDFKASVRKEIKEGDDIFDFPGLRIVKSAKESAELDNLAGPKIILAGSGMSEGGRVVAHEARYLPDPRATIILAGYQAIGTLGRAIQDGNKEVLIDLPRARSDIYGEHAGENSTSKIKVEVRAGIENITGYSSHKDSEHLLEFVQKAAESGPAKKLKKVFVIMGEPKSSLFLCQRIRDYLGIEAVFPEEGRGYEL